MTRYSYFTYSSRVGEAELGIIEIKIPVTRREVDQSVEEQTHSLAWTKVQGKHESAF